MRTGSNNLRYFINAYHHDEDFQWIYLHFKGANETVDEIELYHEFQRYTHNASKASYIEITKEEYSMLADLIGDDDEREYIRKAAEIIDKYMQKN
jgi:hypothetical protein